MRKDSDALRDAASRADRGSPIRCTRTSEGRESKRFGRKTAPGVCGRASGCTGMRQGLLWHGACEGPGDNHVKERHVYAETIDGFAKIAEKKLESLRRHPGGFFVSSMLAGAYVGMGIILIFTLGSQVPPEF